MTGFYKDYADSSDTHQNSAEASADSAEQSATEAATSASEAAASAAAALVSENNASTSESNASASATSASASATSASTDADDAEDSATEAAASALAASNSATTAQNLEITSASFDTADGTLTLTKANSGTVTTDLDGRYAELTGADFTGDVTITNGELTVTGNAEAELFKGDLEGAVHFKGAVASGATLTKGDVVYVSGHSGQKTEVDLADASDSNKMPAFGIVAADPVGVNVDVVTFGTLKSINTSTYTDGDELYVDTTAGGLTATAPSGEGNLVQKIAKVVRAANSGNIKVMGAGRTNATPNLNSGNFFLGDSNNQAVTTSFTTAVSAAETSHTDVLVDSDFNSNGFMKRTGVGTYAIDNSTYATETYVDTAVSGLVDSAPATLDTLNELASALGDDANFSTTVTTSIGTKWTEDATKISNWDTAYSWDDHSTAGYLTAETNDLSTTVTWANVPDANITESSVTQHLTAANVTSPLTGGTGISVAIDGTITNDSPDQTVALTGAGGTSVTGTYPNFTITSTSSNTLTDYVKRLGYDPVNTSSPLLTTSLTIGQLADLYRASLEASVGNAPLGSWSSNRKEVQILFNINGTGNPSQTSGWSSADAFGILSFVGSNYSSAENNNFQTLINTSPYVTQTTIVADILDGDYDHLIDDKVGINVNYATETLDVGGNIAVSGTVDGVDIATLGANAITAHQDISGKANLSGAIFTGNVLIGVPPSGTQSLTVAGTTDLYGGLDLNLTSITGVDALTAKNVDISTAGSVTTNIATGALSTQGDTKTLNLGTGFSSQGTTTVNIGSSSGTINLNGNVAVSGTVDGRDVATDGATLDALERVYRTRFRHRNAETSTFQSLTNVIADIGNPVYTKATTGSENTLDFFLATTCADYFDNNDGNIEVVVTAPNPSYEDVVNLGTVSNTVSNSPQGQHNFDVVGDVTKHLTDYCGLSVNSDGSNSFFYGQVRSNAYYNPSTNKTTISCNQYQSNKPVDGDTVYLHPFDWETSGTAIIGNRIQIDEVVYNAQKMSRKDFSAYLGYFKSSVTIKIRGKEASATTDNIAIRKMEGTLTQVQD